MLITFEGNECTGKSTQIAILADKMRAEGHSVVTIREPGGTELGEQCRELIKHYTGGRMFPETELLLVNASRAQLVRQVIRPALDVGQIVICDRYSDSTVAYQHFGRLLDGKMVADVIRCATGDTVPNLTILLVASRETIRTRKAKRDEEQPYRLDRFESMDQEFFDRVEQGYMTLAENSVNCRVVGADGPVEDVAKDIWANVQSALRMRKVRI